MKKINPEAIQIYLKKLHERGSSASEIHKKLASVDKFIDWAREKGYINKTQFKQVKETIANFKPINNYSTVFGQGQKSTLEPEKATEAESKEKTHFEPFENNRNLAAFLGFILILLFVSILGAGLYSRFFKNTATPFAYPATFTTPSSRFISFQGRLTDSLGNPIIAATNVKFQLYNTSSGSTAVNLYTTGACSITPDQDGIFNSLIGSDCGPTVPNSVFTENTDVYLGVIVGTDAEMTPRQHIANVGYAINAETLQGLPPGTSASNIAFIDSNGTLAAAPSNTAVASTTQYLIKSTAKLTGAIGTAQTNLYAEYAVPTIGLSGGASNTLTNYFGNYIGLGVSLGTVTNYFANYVAAPTGAGAVTNKYAFVSEAGAGKVGIGTTAPTEALVLAGASDNISFSSATGPHQITTGGSTNLAFIPGGNVGIGTTAPGAKLHVYSGASGGTPYSTSDLVIEDSARATLQFLSPNTQDAAIYFGDPESATIGQIGFNHVNNKMSFTTSGGQPQFTIDNNGNIGLGTTTPGATLDVIGTVRVGTTNAAASNALCLDSSNILSACNASSSLTGAGAANYLARWTSATNLSTGISYDNGSFVGIGYTASAGSPSLIVSGNVGIGTTNPGAKLESLATTEQLRLSYDASTPVKFTVSSGGDLTVDAAKLGNNFIRFKVSGAGNASAESLTIKGTSGSKGFVGVNNTSPSYELDVTGSTHITTSAIVGAIGGGSNNMTLNTTSLGAVSGNSNGNPRDVFNLSQAWQVNTQGSERGAILFKVARPNSTGATDLNEVLRVVGSGDTASTGIVGIGTTTPMNKLDVNGGVGIGSYAGSNSAPTNGLIVSGNAGIGSTGFTGATLDVAGTLRVGTTNAAANNSTLCLGTNNILSACTGAAGSVTGNGATNYLARWSSATNLSTGISYDNGTFVGIGYTAAGSGANFVVSGNVGIGTSSPLALLQVGVGSTTGLYVFSNGNVGIGTTAPGDKLDVAGNIRWNGNLTGMAVTSTIQPGGAGWIMNVNANSGSLNLGTATDVITFNGSKSVFNTGNVGIGTTNPHTALEVRSSTTAELLLNRVGAWAGSAAGIKLSTDDAVTDYWTFGMQPNSTNNMYLRYGGGDFMTVLTGGNVGIGTTNPNAKLQVNGDITLSSAFDNGQLNFMANTPNAIISTTRSDNTQQGIFSSDGWGDFGFNKNVGIGSTANLFGAAATLYVNGNVGIGTTGPQTKLDVTTGALGTFAVSLDQGMAIGWRDASNNLGGASIVGNSGTTGQLYLNAGGSGAMIFQTGTTLASGNPSWATGATERMRITSTGNVGIGTTNPAVKLDVAGQVKVQTLSGTATSALCYDGSNILTPCAASSSLTGAGVANYLARWTSATNLSTGVVYDNGTNVGIGTTAPTQKLEVSGTSPKIKISATDTSGDVQLVFAPLDNTGTTISNSSYIQSTWQGGGMIFRLPRDVATHGYKFLNNAGTSLMFIDSASGNVGIGQTIPTNKLSVAGGVGIGASYSAVTAPTNGLIVQGNVGIGSTGFTGATLDVAGTLRVGTTNGASTTQLCLDANNILAGCASSSALTGAGAVNYLARWTSATNLSTGVIYDNGTNVGIGTTAPGQALSVYPSGATGGVEIAAQAPRIYFTDINGGQQSGFIGYDNGIFDFGNAGVPLRINASGGISMGGSYYLTDPGAGNVIISGNVGIGTTGPGYKLDVNGSANLASNNAYYINGQLKLYLNSAGRAALYNGAGTSLEYYNGAAVTEGLVLNSSGNVGIGTTNPSSKLEISDGTSAKINLTKTGTGAETSSIYDDGNLNVNSGSNLWLAAATSGTTFLRAGNSYNVTILGNGNVGIGTTNPAVKLDVAGQVKVQTLSGTATSALCYDGSNILTPCAASSSLTGVGAANYLARWTSATNLSTGVVYDDGSNVGIGTAGPESKLNIRNNTSSIDYSLILTNDDGTPANITGTGVRFGRYGTPWAEVVGQQESASNYNYGKLTFGTRTSDALGVQTKMTISSGGNVGIGTTAPGQKLEVNAGATATSLIQINANNNVNGVRVGFVGGLGGVVGTTTGNMLYLQSSNASIASLDTNGFVVGTGYVGTAAPSNGMIIQGNVGIGTTNPVGKLQAVGNTYIGDSTGTAAYLYLYGNGTAGVTSTLFTSNGNLHIDAANGGYGTYLNYYRGTGGIYFGNGAGGATSIINSSGTFYPTTTNTGSLGAAGNQWANLYTYGNSYLATATGNVGIGTTGPGYKLDAAGTTRLGSAATQVHSLYGITDYNPRNIIRNGDFENWSGGTSTVPTYWSSDPGAGTTSYSRDTTNVEVGYGIASANVNVTAFAAPSYSHFYPGLNTNEYQKPNTIYTIVARVKYLSRTGTPGLRLVTNSTGIDPSNREYNFATGGWQTLSYTYQTGASTGGPYLGYMQAYPTTWATDQINYVVSEVSVYEGYAGFPVTPSLLSDGGYQTLGGLDNSNPMLTVDQQGTADILRLNNTGTNRLTVQAGGNVGIGTTAPANKLSTAGAVSIGSSYAQVTAGANGLIVQGNVGIGSTGFTGATLDVAGTLRVGTTNAAAANQICLDSNNIVSSCSSSSNLTGLGVTNYLARWSSTTNLSTGISYDNGTFVGIGYTAAASGSLVVSGNVGIKTTNPQYGLDVAASGARVMDNFNVQNASNVPLFTVTNGGVGYINNSFGVGTTNPEQSLTTSGSLKLVANATNKGIFADDQVTGGNHIFNITRQGNGTSFTTYDYIGLAANQTGGTSTAYNLFIQNGNVGIATSAPGARLQINDTGGGDIIRLYMASSWNQYYYSDIGWTTGTSATGKFQYGKGFSNDSEFQYLLNGSLKMTLNTSALGVFASNPGSTLGVGGNAAIGASYAQLGAPSNGLIVQGNVGIGSTGFTGATLDVAGTLRVGTTNAAVNAQTLCLGTNNILSACTGGGGSITGTGVTNYLARWTSSTNISTGISYDNGTFVGIGYTAAGSGATLVTSGNVGIGTTSPGQKLHVVGNIWADGGGATLIAGPSGAQAQIYEINGDGRIRFDNTYDNGDFSRTEFRGIKGGVWNTPLTLMNNGKVGIGTTSPGDALDVNGTFRATGQAPATSGSGTEITWDGSVGNVRVYNRTSSTYLPLVLGGSTVQLSQSDGAGLYLNSSGNVGIGITAPLNKLDVNGSVAIGSLPGNSLPQSNSLYVSGNVGLGITNPTRPLDVESGLAGSLAKFGSALPVYLSSSNPGISFNVYNDGSSWKYGKGSSGNYGSIIYGNSTAGGIQFTTWSNSGNADATATGIGTRMTLDKSGNLGIGTTAPANLLDVNGSVAVGTYAGTAATQSNSLIVSGNVGIGTTNPSAALHVNGDAWANRFMDTSNSAFYVDPAASGAGNYNLVFSTGLSYFAGNVGIGASLPVNKLDVFGSAAFGTYGGTAATASNSVIFGGNIGIGTTNAVSQLQLVATATTGTASQFIGNSLTSGTLLSLASTNQNITSGGLLALDFQPAGSSTAFTGDLLSVNVGVSAMGGNLLNLKNNGSSIFSVSQNLVTSAIPAQFNAAGDVSIAYDILMTNQVSSNIKSLGPITLEAGESFESNDLTLRAYNNGSIVLDTPGSVILGGGTSPTIYIGQGSTMSHVIFADNASTAAVKGQTGTWSNGEVHFGSISGGQTAANGRIFLKSNGSIFSFSSTNNLIADYSEYMPQETTGSLEPGDIVNISQLTGKAMKGNLPYDSHIAGAVTTAERGTSYNDLEKNALDDNSHRNDPAWANVGMVGQVYVKVNLENGSIKAGDPITLSTQAGIGMKATMEGMVVGQALQPWDGSQTRDNRAPQQSLPSGVGMILVYVHPTYQGGSFLPSEVLVKAIQGFGYQVQDVTGKIISKTGAFANVIVANINAGVANIDSLITRNFIATGKIQSPIVETGDIVATGTADLAKIKTDEINPKNNDLTINLSGQPSQTSPTMNNAPLATSSGPLAKLVIKGLEGKTVATIDAGGNASFSGTLAASNLSANEASISGTLAAGNVQSNSLNSNEASISGTLIAKNIESDNINEIQRQLAEIRNQPLANPQYYQSLSGQSQIQSIATGSSQPILTDLTVTGTSNLYNLSVANSLTVGSIFAENDSILSLSWDLKLSALSNVRFFDDAVVISKDGNLTTKGSVIAQGGVKTNEIRALNNGQDVNVVLQQDTEASKSAHFNIADALGNVNASVDASGAATFKSLGLEKYLDATSSAALLTPSQNFAKNGLFVPAIETKSESAGVGQIPANQTEVVIYNSGLSDSSLVYLTSTTTTPSNLTVTAKETCKNNPSPLCKPYFKVTTTGLSTSATPFNWLIVK